jgi:hypothetical protein
MKIAAILTLVTSGVSAFHVAPRSSRRSSSLSMVLEKPASKKLAKIEVLKIDSNHLVHPLKEVRCPGY